MTSRNKRLFLEVNISIWKEEFKIVVAYLNFLKNLTFSVPYTFILWIKRQQMLFSETFNQQLIESKSDIQVVRNGEDNKFINKCTEIHG